MSPVAINTEKPVRVLPADVYDTLELSALVWGGIGADAYHDDRGCPLCVYGHAYSAVGPGETSTPASVLSAFTNSRPISTGNNDHAVHAINRRKGTHLRARVTFEEWCAELNVIRGD